MVDHLSELIALGGAAFMLLHADYVIGHSHVQVARIIDRYGSSKKEISRYLEDRLNIRLCYFPLRQTGKTTDTKRN